MITIYIASTEDFQLSVGKRKTGILLYLQCCYSFFICSCVYVCACVCLVRDDQGLLANQIKSNQILILYSPKSQFTNHLSGL